ncbi:MAG: nucleotidyltransferase family protein [Myxococcota bacterium]
MARDVSRGGPLKIDRQSFPRTRAVLAHGAGGDGPWSPDVHARATELGVDALLRHVCSQQRWGSSREGSPRHLQAALLLRRRAAREEVRAALRRWGVHYAILKGEALGVVLYGVPHARRTSDVDVLVRREDLPRAGRALRALGWNPAYDAAPRTWRSDEWGFARARDGLVVELHWALADPMVASPEAAELLVRSVLAQVGSERIPVLSPQDTILNLGYHFHHHSGFFKGLVDLAGAVDRFGEEAALGALRRAAALGAWGVIAWGLGCVEQISGEGCGVGGRAGWRVRAAVELVVRRSRGVMSGAEELEDASAMGFKTRGVAPWEWMAMRMVCMGLLDDPWDRAKGVLEPAAAAMVPGVVERLRRGGRLAPWSRPTSGTKPP